MGWTTDRMLHSAIGANVFKARQKRGMSMAQLARNAAVHQNTLNRVEGGGGVSVRVLCAIAAALDVPIDVLIKGESPDVVMNACVREKRL